MRNGKRTQGIFSDWRDLRLTWADTLSLQATAASRHERWPSSSCPSGRPWFGYPCSALRVFACSARLMNERGQTRPFWSPSRQNLSFPRIIFSAIHLILSCFNIWMGTAFPDNFCPFSFFSHPMCRWVDIMGKDFHKIQKNECKWVQ